MGVVTSFSSDALPQSIRTRIPLQGFSEPMTMVLTGADRNGYRALCDRTAGRHSAEMKQKSVSEALNEGRLNAPPSAGQNRGNGSPHRR